ncbi:hypothetical protein [Embleya scabrispora]|uniref:hypothetical protein n=1 Tax=Embleya scabrispora TaxID=159449 RepID=UPI00036BF72D|nr:hypothetical protein [Embleya scabrispora]MYS83431.1 hypothetical protein [Streptomyces sp. SID5474]
MPSRFAPGKITVALGAAIVLGTTGLVVLAPSALAAEVDYNARCVNRTLPSLEIPDTNLKLDLVVTPAKATYQVGDVVNVEWQWKTHAKVPKNPYTPGVDKDSTLPTTNVQLGGAMTNKVELKGQRINPAALAGEDLILTNPVGQFTLTTAGQVTLTPAAYNTSTIAFGTVESFTDCTPLNSVAAAQTLTVEGATQTPTLAANPATVAAGAATALSGANWSSGQVTPSLCKADGTACDPAGIKANSLAVSHGALTGNVSIADAVAPGDYVIKVSNGGASASTPIKVTPAAVRTVTISPDHGPVGTSVTITGTGFAPNGGVQFAWSDASDVPDETSYVTADASGSFTATTEMYFEGFTQLMVTETGAWGSNPIKHLPFRVTEPPTGGLEQTITGAVTPGALTITQQASAIKLSDITLNGQAQNMTGALNPVTVKDFRGGATGWTLTGAVTPFTNGDGGTIAADKFSWTPKVAAGPGSPSVAVAGAAGPIGSGATLASAPNAAVTGGTFTADADLSLAVPAYQKIGTYSATLTLSIS